MVNPKTSITKTIIEKALECLTGLLPFLRKEDAAKMKGSSQLVIGQYELLMGQFEKTLKGYFGLSLKVKGVHAEVISLREELLETLSLRCRLKEYERGEAIREKLI